MSNNKVPNAESQTAVKNEIELDLNTLMTPIAIVIGAILISVPVSLSIYFGLVNSGTGSGSTLGVTALAETCESGSPLSTGCLVKNAQDLGLDTTKFAQCLKDKTFDADITAEQKSGDTYKVGGTPTLFIGENKGTGMRGFQISAGVTEAQLTGLVDKIQSAGADTAAKYWVDTQTADLPAFEKQVKDYYTQQGQTGTALDNIVKQTVDQKKTDIASEGAVADYDYGKGNLRGNQNAKVVIMEFSDFECPYCIQFANGVGKTIQDSFVATNKAMFVFRDFPLETLHKDARKAANAARCAQDQGKFFEYHDKVFTSEKSA